MQERRFSSRSDGYAVFYKTFEDKKIKKDSKKHLALNGESDNKYGFILQNPKQLRIPIPCTGQLNFFEFKPELTKMNEIKTELFEEEHRYMWINHH